MKIQGWTIAFVVIGCLFLPFGEAGLMAAVFWWSIAGTNELVSRI